MGGGEDCQFLTDAAGPAVTSAIIHRSIIAVYLEATPIKRLTGGILIASCTPAAGRGTPARTHPRWSPSSNHSFTSRRLSVCVYTTYVHSGA